MPSERFLGFGTKSLKRSNCTATSPTNCGSSSESEAVSTGADLDDAEFWWLGTEDWAAAVGGRDVDWEGREGALVGRTTGSSVWTGFKQAWVRNHWSPWSKPATKIRSSLLLLRLADAPPRSPRGMHWPSSTASTTELITQRKIQNGPNQEETNKQYGLQSFLLLEPKLVKWRDLEESYALCMGEGTLHHVFLLFGRKTSEKGITHQYFATWHKVLGVQKLKRILLNATGMFIYESMLMMFNIDPYPSPYPTTQTVQGSASQWFALSTFQELDLFLVPGREPNANWLGRSSHNGFPLDFQHHFHQNSSYGPQKKAIPGHSHYLLQQPPVCQDYLSRLLDRFPQTPLAGGHAGYSRHRHPKSHTGSADSSSGSSSQCLPLKWFCHILLTLLVKLSRTMSCSANIRLVSTVSASTYITAIVRHQKTPIISSGHRSVCLKTSCQQGKTISSKPQAVSVLQWLPTVLPSKIIGLLVAPLAAACPAPPRDWPSGSQIWQPPFSEPCGMWSHKFEFLAMGHSTAIFNI